MMISISIISDILIYCLMSQVSSLVVTNSKSDPVMVSRSQWNARPPKAIEEMTHPVPFVIIHHSHTPPACTTTEECMKAMQWMQNFHLDERKWWDIGYSFAAGGDGRIYEGRGWSRVGAHAPQYNNISIGICLIGDWSDTLPSELQLQIVKKLIQTGVRDGKIALNYKLIGHKQVRDGTTCPGDKLFEEIKTWPHFTKAPDNSGYIKKKIQTVLTIPDFSNKIKRKNLIGDDEDDDTNKDS